VTEPRDEIAERAVVGELLRLTAVPDLPMTPEDIWHPQVRAVALACWDLTARGLPCNLPAVRDETLRRGERGPCTDGVWLADLLAAGFPGLVHHARIVRARSVQRQVIAATTRALQQLESPTADAYDVAAQAALQLGVLADSDSAPALSAVSDAEEFMAGPTGYDWLVPDLLERGDRLIVTSVEGGGKSTLLRQLAVCLAAGLHPFAHSPVEAKRVLLVDLENPTRLLRRKLRPLFELCAQAGRTVAKDRMFIESRPAGIDLSRAEDDVWLDRLCASVQPDLLVIGPLYKMHTTDMGKEEPARHLTCSLDSLRARYGCALVMETHAGHGSGLGERGLRPIGSSLFMRWPEFGYGIAGRWDAGRPVRFKPWRGARDERTGWPEALKPGGPGRWPWEGVRVASQAEESFWRSVEAS